MTSLRGQTYFVTGASRGIGKAMALRLAREGANVAIASKTDKPHRVLPGTIHSTADDIEAAGGHALALRMDVRDDEQVRDAVGTAANHFGGIDGLINNASAISLTGTLLTPMRRFDLMFGVNVRGTYACSQAALPHLLNSDRGHILNIAPPLNLDPRWFRDHVAYTMAKYGMSMCVLGMAAEFGEQGLSVNALWPKTAIDTAALRQLGDSVSASQCRTPGIMADAAFEILRQKPGVVNGQFLIDEDVLRAAGVEDLDQYAVDASQPLLPDFFL